MATNNLIPASELKKIVGGKKRNKKVEENVQILVCKYIKEKYPDVIFSCDLASGMKLPIHVAARHKKMRSSAGLPDLFIAYPNTWYKGLFIELKREDVRLKNGGIAKSPHHDEQAAILYRLSKLGYKAVFACGFQETKEIIDKYME